LKEHEGTKHLIQFIVDAVKLLADKDGFCEAVGTAKMSHRSPCCNL
jgi:hypothetical protein